MLANTNELISAHKRSQMCKVSSPEKHMTGAAGGGPLESVHPEVVRVKCGILRPNIRSEMEKQKHGKVC